MKRKRGSGRRKPKNLLEAVSINDEGCSNWGDHVNNVFDSRREVQKTPADATVRDQIAGFQDPVFVEKANGGNSERESNLFKNVASFAAKLSRTGGSSSIGPCRDERPLRHVTDRFRDPQHNEKELTAATLVIEKVIEMDAAKPFVDIVDPAAWGIPNYFDVFETPMDFTTIRNMLLVGLKYKTSKDVLKDVKVMWDYCVKYNKEANYDLELTKRLKLNFMKLWTAAGLSWEQQETTNVHLERNPNHDTKYTMKNNGDGHFCTAGSISKVNCQEQPKLMGRCHVARKQQSSYCSYASQPQQISSECQCRRGYRELQSCQPQSSRHTAADESTMGNNLCTHMRPGFCFREKHYSRWQDEISPQEELAHQPSHSCSLQCHPYEKSCQYQSSYSHLRPSIQQAYMNTQSGGLRQSPADGALSSSTHNKNEHVCTSSPMTGNANHQNEYQICSSHINKHQASFMPTDQYQRHQKSCERQSNSSECRGNEPDVTNTCDAGHPHMNLPVTSTMRCAKRRLEYSMASEAGVHSHKHQCIIDPSQLQSLSMKCTRSYQPQGKSCQCHPELGPSEGPDPSLLQDANIGGAGCSRTPPPFESTLRHARCRFESSLALATDGGSYQREYQMGPNASKSPSFNNSLSQEPEENGHLSQPSPSSPEPSQPEAEGNICNGDSTGLERKTRGRGPTRCLNLLREGKRISIRINELGEPVGLEAPKLTSFLGTLARNGLLAPLTYINWPAVPKANKENMWEKVQTKFEIDARSKNWVLKSLGKKWKDWKSKLKTAHYITHATDEERLADRDERVLPEQWAYLVSHWSSEEAEKRSATNKANRARQKFRHVTGTKSFARIREEQRTKRSDGKAPSRAELFILTRIRKDGRPVNEASSAVITQLREIASQQHDTSQDSAAQDEALSQVVGRDRQGRVRCYQLGPSPYDIRGAKHTNTEAMKMVSEVNAEVREMKERLVAMEQTCAQMAAQMATMKSMMQKTTPDKDVPDLVPINSVTSKDLPEKQVHSIPLRRSGRRVKI